MAGEIVHLELPSRNFERSAAFYGKLFGWRAGPAQSGGHLRFETSHEAEGEGATGGDPPPMTGSFILSALAQSPGPLPFIAVDDVAATLAEAELQGGRILVARMQLAGQGEFGILADLDGNIIAVLARAAAPASRRSAEPAAAPAPKTTADTDDDVADADAEPVASAKAPAPAGKPAKPEPSARAREIGKEKAAEPAKNEAPKNEPAKKAAPSARASTGKSPPKAGGPRKR